MTSCERWQRIEWQRLDPDPDALRLHGGPQCPAMDGVYHCTLRAGHDAASHKTWNGDRYVCIWEDD